MLETRDDKNSLIQSSLSGREQNDSDTIDQNGDQEGDNNNLERGSSSFVSPLSLPAPSISSNIDDVRDKKRDRDVDGSTNKTQSEEGKGKKGKRST